MVPQHKTYLQLVDEPVDTVRAPRQLVRLRGCQGVDEVVHTPDHLVLVEHCHRNGWLKVPTHSEEQKTYASPQPVCA